MEEYAQRRGQDAVAALVSVLADYFDWEEKEYQEAAEEIREGLEDMGAERTSPADEVFERLRVKHGLPS